MTTRFKLLLIFVFTLLITSAFSQEDDYQIRTLFNQKGKISHGGYGAIGNKFTRIRGEYANMAEVYGGWYINHRFLLGVGAAAVTSDLKVPQEYRVLPNYRMSYEYGQVGLMTEYTLWSNRAIHFSFHALTGAGFTVQYIRNEWEKNGEAVKELDENRDENWFFVAEPGISVEMNVFKWMRFSPGVSYRIASGSNGLGLKDSDLKDYSLNLTLKFGKF